MICNRCQNERGDDFSSGRRECRPCRAEKARNAYAANPEKYRQRSRANRKPGSAQYDKILARNRAYRRDNPVRATKWARDHNRKSSGWGKGEFEADVAEQGGFCAIPGCRRPATDADHCHEGGHRRGALCSGCNKALGLLGDSVARLSGLIAYLSDHCGDDCGEMVIAGVPHLDYRDV